MPHTLQGLTQRPEWRALTALRDQLAQTNLRDLFDRDPQRAQRYLASAAGLTLDFSRNRLTDDVLQALDALADACGLPERRAALLRGDIVNPTENRPALHTALRQPAGSEVRVKGQNVVPEIQATLERMETLVKAVHQGERTGYSDKPFTDVVSIGIGGSFLGPKLVVEALAPYAREGMNCHFVANIDGTDIQETLSNSLVAREWFLTHGGDVAAIARHFLAVTTNIKDAKHFGIDEHNIFPMWDWVGGRYSLWSAIGLPIALTLGMEHFHALLEGAHDMDRHFAEAPTAQNLPVLMALLSVCLLYTSPSPRD